MTDSQIRSRLQAAAKAPAEEAEAIYREILAIEPEDPHALYFLGALLAGRGAFAEGHEYVKRASRAHVKLFDASPDQHHVVGLTRFLEKAAFPGCSPLTYWAYVTAKFGNYALKDEIDVSLWIYILKLTLRDMPRSFDARMGDVTVDEYLSLNLARLYMVLRDWEQVEHYARLAFQDSPTVQQCLIEALLEQGKYAVEHQGMLALSTLDATPGSIHPLLDLPPVQWEQTAAPGRGRVLFISADAGYFEKFSIAQALSAIEFEPALTIHFHVVNPTPRTYELMAQVRAIHPAAALSTERVDFEKLGYLPEDRAFYYCNIRFVRLAQLRRHYPQALICATDSDTLFVRDLDQIVGDPGGYGVLLDKLPEERQGMVLVGHRIGAALIMVAPNVAGQLFVDVLADFIGANMRRTVFWFLDQIALYCVTKHLSDRYRNVVAFFDSDEMNACFVNGHYLRKFEDNPYSRRRSEVLERNGFDPDLGHVRRQAETHKEQYDKTITGVRRLNRRPAA